METVGKCKVVKGAKRSRHHSSTNYTIKKVNRHNQLLKKRLAKATATDNATGSAWQTDSNLDEAHQVLLSPTSSAEEKGQATQVFRKSLAVQDRRHMDKVLAYGILDRCVSNLTAQPEEDFLILESMLALANACCNHRVEEVVRAGAIPPVASLLGHSNVFICKYATWCLGNIGDDSPRLRDMVLAQTAVMENMGMNLIRSPDLQFIETVLWTITVLCSGRPEFNRVRVVVKPLCSILTEHYDILSGSVREHLVRALAHLSSGPEHQAQYVVATGVMPKLVQILQQEPVNEVTPQVLKCLVNFVYCNKEIIQELVDTGILLHLNRIFDDGSVAAQAEACVFLSTIVCDSKESLSAVVRVKGLLSRVSDLASDAGWSVKEEALWLLANMCNQEEDAFPLQVVRWGGVKPIIEFLGTNLGDEDLILRVLDATDRIMEVGLTNNLDYSTLVEEYGGTEYLEQKQLHISNKVYKKAAAILDKYFLTEDVENAYLLTKGKEHEFNLRTPPRFGDISNRH